MLWTLLLITSAHAHDARPLSVTLTEQQPGLYLARLRAPPSIAVDNRPEFSWPADCHIQTSRTGFDASAMTETIFATCKSGLEGRTLGIRFPIYNPSLATLFRLNAHDGRTVTQILPPDRLAWTVPARAGPWRVARDYLGLGIEHIWTGIDHLLFVAGLLILAGAMRRVLLAITGFTLAHSVTLSLSALRLVELPVSPVEAAISLSILFVAREIAAPQPEGLAARYPIMVATAFGLLHGFGFAAALREVGLPTGELAIGLLCFNLGVEVGQVAFIAAGVTLYLLARKLPVPGLSHSRRIAGYMLGIPAAFWFAERFQSLLV